LFYLVYTDVKRYGRASQPGSGGATFRDFHNYVVTSPRIDGPWSDPVYLNSSGFDPSLFHDDDGRKYLLNMLWDHRPGQNRFAGIVLQEYSAVQQTLVGPRRLIFKARPSGSPGPFCTSVTLLLPADGGGRHRVGPRRDDGSIAITRGALRTAPRCLHHDRPRPP
jgi:xylan 1,4-beta-xylosidase